MYQIIMKADASKAAGHHTMAAGAAKILLKHVLEHAPSGAHAHVPVPIPVGEYTAEMSDDHHGNTVITFVPGRVP